MDEGFVSPVGMHNPQIIPKTHDIHLDMAGAPPAINQGGGHQLAGVSIGGIAGVGDAAVARVGNVGQGISTPRGTEDPRSPSTNLVDGFFVGSEVGRVFLITVSFLVQHQLTHEGRNTAHNVSVYSTRLDLVTLAQKRLLSGLRPQKAC